MCYIRPKNGSIKGAAAIWLKTILLQPHFIFHIYGNVKNYSRGVGKIAQNGRNELFSSEGGKKPPDGVRLYAERFIPFIVCRH